jgi:hypothetical protein
MTQANNTLRNEVIVNVTNNFNDVKQNVQDAFPSIYTKDDVLRLLTQLESKLIQGVSDIKFETTDTEGLEIHMTESVKIDLIGAIVDEINCLDIKDYIEIDYSSAEFSLSGNEIELDSVDFEEHGTGWDRDIKRICNQVIDSYLEEAKRDVVITNA